MTKKLMLLNGLAIFAVVCNHASGWGFTDMFWWANRYRAVSVPNYDMVGTLPYYFLSIVQQLALFSVPAFLFTTGFFVAYAARSEKSGLSWKMILTRLTNLLVPYMIWSAFIFASDQFLGRRYSIEEFLVRLVTGRLIDAYFFIPVLFELYLLSPFVVHLAKKNWKLLLLVAGLLQGAAVSLRYWNFFSPVEKLPAPILYGLDRFFGSWGVYFVLGVILSIHMVEFKQWLEQNKTWLLAGLVIFGIGVIVESDVVSQLTGRQWVGPGLLTANLYSIAFIFVFLAFESFTLPSPELFKLLAKNSFGIYLIHTLILEFVAKLIYHFTPLLLSSQIIFLLLLIGFGIGLPVAFMLVVANSPARISYRYLFG